MIKIMFFFKNIGFQLVFKKINSSKEKFLRAIIEVPSEQQQ